MRNIAARIKSSRGVALGILHRESLILRSIQNSILVLPSSHFGACAVYQFSTSDVARRDKSTTFPASSVVHTWHTQDGHTFILSYVDGDDALGKVGRAIMLGNSHSKRQRYGALSYPTSIWQSLSRNLKTRESLQPLKLYSS